MKVCELTTDLRGVITQASEETAELLAIERRWLIRKPLASFVSAGDRRRFRKLLLELAAGTRSRGGAFVLLNRALTEIPVELEGTQNRGAVAWRLASLAEWSPEASNGAPARGELRPRVLARERQFHRLLTRMPLGVLVVSEKLEVEYANPAGRRLLGITNARPGAPLLDPSPGFLIRRLAASFFSRYPEVGVHLMSADDRVLSVEGLSSADGQSAVLLLDDVTDRERARRAEQQFVQNAAHELRTPIASIVSAVDVLEGGAADDEEARRQFLAHIRTQSERLRRLSTSLLTLARVQAGHENLRLDLIPVKPLLQEVADDLQPSVGVEVDTQAPKDLAVLADRDLLEHAIGNVASNAARHTTKGKISFVGRDLGQTAEIEVIDTGPGMTANDRTHAFDRFFRSGDGNSAGFGLGLAIAREAVHALDGAMELDSTAEGTTVRIWLPSARLTY